jgi:DNA invertase Pin-like site-specific DNA recombinase
MGCSRIYEDRLGGAKAERPGLQRALEMARSGDVLVVWRLDRLGRSLKDLIQTMETLEERGIELQSLQESIATTSSGGKLVFHLFGAKRRVRAQPNPRTNSSGVKSGSSPRAQRWSSQSPRPS